MKLEVNVKERDAGIYIISVDGRIDADNSYIFEEKVKSLLDPGTRTLVFDMSGLEYISSSGLGVLFNARKNIVDKNKGSFLIINLQPQIQKVFDIVKALPDVHIFKSVEELDAYLGKIQQREIDREKDSRGGDTKLDFGRY